MNDVANCIVMAVKALEQPKGQSPHPSSYFSNHVLNVGTGIPTSINELARKMIEISGFNLKPIYLNETGQGEIRDSYADTRLAESYLHFKAEHKLESGLKEIINNPIHEDY